MKPNFQFLGFTLALRDALLDSTSFAHLRFQTAARALGFHLQIGKLAAQIRQPLFRLVARRLQAFAFLFFSGDALRQRA